MLVEISGLVSKGQFGNIYSVFVLMLRDGKLNEKKNGETKQVGVVPGVFTLGKLPTLILIN